MTKRYSVPLLPLIMAALILIDGCAAEIPAGGKSAREIYAEQRPRIHRPAGHGARDLDGYTRTAHNELTLKFPRLPNPEMILYVFPHIAGGAPVPGYSTTFTLYPGTEYALPGEIQTRRVTQ